MRLPALPADIATACTTAATAAITAAASACAAPAHAAAPMTHQHSLTTTSTIRAQAAVSDPTWDPGTGLWWTWSWTGSAWTPVAWWDGNHWQAWSAPAPTRSATPSTTDPNENSQTNSPTNQGSNQATNQRANPQGNSGATFAGQTLSGTLTTTHWPGREVHWIVATPQGTPKGTVVVLHGKTDSAQKAYDELGLAELAKSSGYALAAIDGESTYWTDFDGIDTGAMVRDDFLPLLARQGLPTDRVALTGYSMGGLGALRLAEDLGPDRVSAVMPMSAAVWEGGKPGAEGQAQERVRADAGRLAGIPVRIVSGTEDDLTEPNKSLWAVSRILDGFLGVFLRSSGCCCAVVGECLEWGSVAQG